MKLKNKNLTLLKSLSLSKRQRNLEHSKQKILKRSLFQLFQLSLFVSAFTLQTPDHPPFELDSSFKQNYSSKGSLHLKINLFVLNTADASPSHTCNEGDDRTTLNTNLNKLTEKLNKLNVSLRSVPDSERERIKAIINNVKSKIRVCEEKIRGLIDGPDGPDEPGDLDKYNCKNGDSEGEIDDKIREIESNLDNIKVEIEKRDEPRTVLVKDFDEFKRKNPGTDSPLELLQLFKGYLGLKQKKCNKLKNKIETCNKAKDEFDNTKKEFRRGCGQFSKLGINCEEFILGCASCPTSEDKDSSYDCVKIHNQSKCPELAGPELEKARELIKDFKDDLAEAKDDIQDLQKDLVDAENELNRELVEREEDFTSLVSEFKRTTDNAKKELEAGFSEARQSINAGLNKEIAEVQGTIDKKLAISHSFENALTQAHRAYSLEVQKIQGECRQEAVTRLMNYRSKRRIAIANGSYRVSFSQLTSKRRVNFHEQDQNLLKYYNRFCLRGRKQDLENADINYKIALRKIEQEKQQFEAALNSMKARLSQLVNQASSQEKSLVQSYVKRMSKNMDQFEKNYKGALETYNKNKQSLIFTESKKINQLRGAIALKSREIKELEQSLSQQRGLEGYLKSKGTSKEEDRQNDFADLTADFSDYATHKERNWKNCSCGDEGSYDSTKCPASKRDYESFKKRQKKIERGGRR